MPPSAADRTLAWAGHTAVELAEPAIPFAVQAAASAAAFTVGMAATQVRGELTPLSSAGGGGGRRACAGRRVEEERPGIDGHTRRPHAPESPATPPG